MVNVLLNYYILLTYDMVDTDDIDIGKYDYYLLKQFSNVVRLIIKYSHLLLITTYKTTWCHGPDDFTLARQ